MRKKVISYLGFAKKSGNLMSGAGTCTFAMAKQKKRKCASDMKKPKNVDVLTKTAKKK